MDVPCVDSVPQGSSAADSGGLGSAQTRRVTRVTAVQFHLPAAAVLSPKLSPSHRLRTRRSRLRLAERGRDEESSQERERERERETGLDLLL